MSVCVGLSLHPQAKCVLPPAFCKALKQIAEGAAGGLSEELELVLRFTAAVLRMHLDSDRVMSAVACLRLTFPFA